MSNPSEENNASLSAVGTTALPRRSTSNMYSSYSQTEQRRQREKEEGQRRLREENKVNFEKRKTLFDERKKHGQIESGILSQTFDIARKRYKDTSGYTADEFKDFTAYLIDSARDQIRTKKKNVDSLLPQFCDSIEKKLTKVIAKTEFDQMHKALCEDHRPLTNESLTQYGQTFEEFIKAESISVYMIDEEDLDPDKMLNKFQGLPVSQEFKETHISVVKRCHQLLQADQEAKTKNYEIHARMN